MHQPISSHEPCVLGMCLLDGYENELYPATTCSQSEFEDLTITSHYLKFNVVLKSDVTQIVDTFIRKMCYGVDLD